VLRQSLRDKVKLLHSLNVTSEEFYTTKVFPRVPFQKPLSRVFLNACKNNNLAAVEELLN
jgi:hypothetical protein